MSKERSGECPFSHAGGVNNDWWPRRLRLDILHRHSGKSDPMDLGFDYASEFLSLDMVALKRDLAVLMTDTQSWWPADFGHYGPLFVRMAWHSAGTYRAIDGRGGAGRGQQRYAPLNSWPDNANLDKARRLLWPVKQKYGRKISWADLFILAGNVALDSMGFTTLGFAGGRQDTWEPDDDVFWGRETAWLAADSRYAHAAAGDNRPSQMVSDDAANGGLFSRDLEQPLAATQMGLIYVNPEGPDGHPDPLAAALDIRATFARMGMDDEETVALIAGGHSFGKTHGAAATENVGVAPESACLASQGLGWLNGYRTGSGADTITSGLEVTWTRTPVHWSHDFFTHLFGYEWVLGNSPAGAWQWYAKDAVSTIPDAHEPLTMLPPTMLTTDLALRWDPVYEQISRRFLASPEQFALAFARAWFKLTHRDMGPKRRYLGSEVPAEDFPWQDPLPQCRHLLITDADIAMLKARLFDSGLTVPELVATAWASASTYRGSDHRGGADGARIRLAPQNAWPVNQPGQLSRVLSTLECIQRTFNSSAQHGRQVSLADLVVLAGGVGIEQAAQSAGHPVVVPFRPGRVDAAQDQTDIASFALLEPAADGFRNYQRAEDATSAEYLLLDRAQLLTLTAPEMTVLVGGLRVLGANSGRSSLGVFTTRVGTLSTDFFTNLLDPNTVWTPVSAAADTFVGRRRGDGSVKWCASRVDLVFGSNSQLRALAEVYACADAPAKFVTDFVAAWAKVMELGRC